MRNGSPAFPVPNDANVNDQEGMTLLDFIAVGAMKGILSNPALVEQIAAKEGTKTVAIWAYEQAKEMLAEKAKEERG
jgi:hypothetical protein